MSAHSDLVAIATDFHHRKFVETGNPIHAWCAYVQARRLKGIPGWILEYFDNVAARLIAPEGTKDPKAIAASLGLRTRGGGPSARERALTAKRNAAVLDRVANELDKGATMKAAVAKVADQACLSPDRVRNIVYGKLKAYRKLQK